MVLPIAMLASPPPLPSRCTPDSPPAPSVPAISLKPVPAASPMAKASENDSKRQRLEATINYSDSIAGDPIFEGVTAETVAASEARAKDANPQAKTPLTTMTPAKQVQF